MEQIISIPFTKSGEKNTKNLIILTLKEKFPLTLNEIHLNLNEYFGLNVTYQGSRKAVLQLKKEGIVYEKTKRKYLLNGDWIKEIENFSNDLKYYKKERLPKLTDMRRGETQIIEFNSIMIKPYLWLLEQTYQISKLQKKKSSFVGYFYITWPVTMIGADDFYKLQYVFDKNKPYILDYFDGEYSRNMAEYWKNSFNAKYHLGVKLGKDEIIIIDDYYIVKREPKTSIDVYMKMLLNPKLDELGNLYKKLFSKKASLIFEVTRNASIADKKRKELRAYF